MPRKNLKPEFKKYPKSISISFEEMNFIDQYIPCLSRFVSDKLSEEMVKVGQHESTYAYEALIMDIWPIYLSKRVYGVGPAQKLLKSSVTTDLKEKFGVPDLDIKVIYQDLESKFKQEIRSGRLRTLKRRP